MDRAIAIERQFIRPEAPPQNNIVTVAPIEHLASYGKLAEA
jgi:hypothetical protein